MRRLFFLAILLSLAGCATPPPERPGVPLRLIKMPRWAHTGEHPDFPADKFVTAYALADTELAARRKAETLLEEAISHEALAQGEAVLRGSRLLDLVGGEAQWLRASEFSDAIRFDFAGNGFEAVAVNAISRDELTLRAQALLGPARDAFKQSQPPFDAGDLRKRLDAQCRKFLDAMRVLALALLATGEMEREALEAAEAAALTLWSLPGDIEAQQQGQFQYARIGGGLAKPLEIALHFRGKPAAGVPVGWSVQAPVAGVIDATTETDAAGSARCAVFSLVATGRETALVLCAIDLARVAGIKLGISPPVWKFTALLPCRRLGQLVCEITETSMGQNAPAVLAPRLLNWCEANRLAFTDDAKQPLPETLAYRLRLSGTLKAALYKQGESTVARAEGTLTLTDTSADTPLYLYMPTGERKLAEGQRAEDAVREALKEAAEDALAQIGPRILAALPSS